MPIYEYQCEKCGHHLEALQKISDKPLRECPECGRHRLKRLMSAPRFRLAGSGWYETDFKSDQESKRNLLEKGDKDAPKAEATTESKPEAKAESKPESRPAAKPESTRGEKTRTMVTKPSVKSSPRPKAKTPARRSGSTPGRKR